MIKPKVVLLIFVSGKIVLTGAKVTQFPALLIDAFDCASSIG
jgi:TATA-box binding protein (TBP) (component of TFIID and TFIIIB)